MKLYHIIGLSTASLLSLGALGLMAQTEATPYNKIGRASCRERV